MAEDYNKKVIVKNLSSSTTWTHDYLQNFLESVTPLAIANNGIHIFNGFTDTALLTLEESLSAASFQEATESLEKMPFEKRKLSLEPVRKPTHSILLYLTDTSLSRDDVCSYFENSRYSGRGDAHVDLCQVYHEERLAVVRFSSIEAVNWVLLKRQHYIKKGAKPIKPEAWYEQFHGPLLDRLRYHREAVHNPVRPPQPLHETTGRRGYADASITQINPEPYREKEASLTNRMKILELEDMHQKTIQQHEREKERLEKENQKLKHLSERYVPVPGHKLPLLKDFVMRWKGCTMTPLEEKEEILLIGNDEDLKDGERQLRVELKRVYDKTIYLSKAAVRFLETDKGKSYLENMVGKYNRCSAKLQGTCVLCAAFEKEKLQALCKELRDSISDKTCKVPSNLFCLPDYHTLKAALEGDPLVLVTVLDEDVQLHGDTNAVEQAAKRLDKFTNQHRSDKKTFRIRGALQASIVKDWFMNELDDVKQIINKNQGEVKEDSAGNCYSLTFNCRHDVLPGVMRKLDAIKQNIVTFSIDLDGMFPQSCDRALVVNGIHTMGVEVFRSQLKRALLTQSPSAKYTVDIQLPPKCFLQPFRGFSRQKGWRDGRHGANKKYHHGRRGSYEKPTYQQDPQLRSELTGFEERPLRSPLEGRSGGRHRRGGRDRFSGRFDSKPCGVVNIGETQITVKCGDITHEQVDAAVSMVGTDLDIKGTSIGSAFLKKFPSLEQVLRQEHKTEGCRLLMTSFTEGALPMSVRVLFHAVLTKAPHDEVTKNVKYLVDTVLGQAVKDGLMSVAFPAIGVGRRFHYKCYTVACAMVSSIKEYLCKNPNSLQMINIVVSDPSTLATFTKVLGQTQTEEKFTPAGAASPFVASKPPRSSRPDFERFDSPLFPTQRSHEDSRAEKFEVQVCTTRNHDSRMVGDILLDELKTTFLAEKPIYDTEAFKKLGSDQVDKISECAASNNVHISFYGKEITVRGQRESTAEVLLKIRTEITEQTQQQKKKGLSERKKLGLPVNTDLLPSYWKVCKYNRSIDYDAAVESWKQYGTDRTNRVPQDTKEAIEKLVQATWEPEKVSHGSDAKGLQAGYNMKILNIERLENPKLWQDYSRQREAIFKTLQDTMRSYCTPVEQLKYSTGPVATTASFDKKSPLAQDIYPQINEHYLFHGTKKDVLHKICSQGPDFRLAKKSMVGFGVYAAESPTKSDQYVDAKHERTSEEEELKMILMRVLLGEPFLHTAEMQYTSYQRPPCMSCLQPQCLCPCSQLFNSVIFDSTKMFREFITYDHNVCYPEYIITYKREYPM